MCSILINGQDIHTFSLLRLSDDPAVETACDVLKKYLSLGEGGCGGKILVGLVQDTPLPAEEIADVKEEGIYLRIAGDTVYICGGSGRGVLYAAYDFLERFCNWGFYTPTLETAPEGTVEMGDKTYRFNPPFEYRMNLLPSAGEGTPQFLKRHLNARWGTIPEPDTLGGSVTYANTNCHTFQELLPDSVYFDEHPEYFAMDEKGERKRDLHNGTQPCLSHPMVFDIMLQGVKKALREHPSARFVSVSQNDGAEFCHCEVCRKVNEEEQTDGGTVFRFVNRIAEAIEPEFPHVLVDTIPYNYSTKPPVKTVMRDNVSIRLCLMECCREHTITDESCPYNAKVRAYLDGWAKCCRHLEIWDYNANFFNYPISVPNLKLLYQNMKRLRCYPVKGIMFLGAHTTNPNIEFSELWGYLQGCLAWDPDMSYAEYLTRTQKFLQAYYGAGWHYLYDYLMLTMLQPSSDYHYGPGARCEQVIPMLRLPDGNPDMTFIRDGNELFDLAEQVSSGEALAHIKRSRMHLTWYEICTTYGHIRAHGTTEEKEALRHKYEEFFSTVNKWKGFKLNERNPMFGKDFDFERDPNSFIG